MPVSAWCDGSNVDTHMLRWDRPELLATNRRDSLRGTYTIHCRPCQHSISLVYRQPSPDLWPFTRNHTLTFHLKTYAKAYITIAIRRRHDYDEKLTCSFFARVEWKQARAIRRSRIVVVSQSNRTHIEISITSVVVECVVVSSYCSRFVVESQLWYRLRYDYDPTTTYCARLLPFDAIRREQKMNMSIFRRSLVVVVSQSNRTQIVISIISVVVECVVVSSYRTSYRSRIAIVITARFFTVRMPLLLPNQRRQSTKGLTS